MKITFTKTTFILIIILCLASIDTGSARDRKKRVRRKYRGVVIKKAEPEQSDTVTVDTVTEKIRPADTLPTPVTVPVSDWPGKKFRLLEKTKMFQRFGYELYTSPHFSDEKTAPDTRIEHANHRLKYEVFNGRTITAVAVQKMAGGEYHITFKADTLNLTVYGKTSNGIIEGIALFSDFAAAEKRWKGKIIFSRRRSIEMFDSVASRFSSVRVSTTEPLFVKRIRWGVTPLPPKSLWLIVVRKDGSEGFIPLNYSWTNVLREDDTEKLPWERDIFEHDPRKLYSWEEYIWETIDNHNICTGMTTEQVRFSWGVPKEMQTVTDRDGRKITTYTYSGKTLRFVNDTLKSTVK